jgi:hypothetical protein
MKPINPPLRSGDQGPEVANLQDGLRLLLEKRHFQMPDDERKFLSDGLQREQDVDRLYGGATAMLVTRFQKQSGLPLSTEAVVDQPTADALNRLLDELTGPGNGHPAFVVRGTVRLADGSPAAGVAVAAFDRDLRSEEPLGNTLTDESGGYEIAYAAHQFRRAEKKTADLMVRVGNGNGPPLATSPIRFNAPPELKEDIMIGGGEFQGPSEYERYVAELAPVLENVAFADLTEDDLTFLTGETEINAQHLSFLVAAARLSPQTGLPREVFYGLFRQNLPTDLPALLAQHPQVQRLTLTLALKQNIIPARFANELDAILQRLHELVVEQALRPSRSQGRASLGDLVGTTVLSADGQERFVRLFVEHQGAMGEFWKGLRDSAEFAQPGLVDDLKFTLELGTLTQNHLPLVRVLQQLRHDGKVFTPRDLARWDEKKWAQQIQTQNGNGIVGLPSNIPGNTAAEKMSHYVHSIMSRLEASFPTAVIARHVAKEKDDLPNKPDLVQFFANNPEFEFGTIPIHRYMANNGRTALAGVEDKAGVTRQLKAMERIFKVAPRYDQMRPLLADGLHSAQSIALMGEDTFVSTYSPKLGGEANARDIHAASSDIALTALAISAKYGSSYNSTGLAVVAPLPDEVKEFPEWKSLFGSLELCGCEYCRSVLSPAAYLVDVLHLLAPKAPSKFGSISNLDRLFQRRPDIGEIELSCENTNTPLPYIDLVNEVLENAVRLDPKPVRTAAALHEMWQTRNTAAELAANPEHINVEAYEKLAEQVYPLDLPFDLWSQETRVYLDHLEVPRHQVMDVFQKRDAVTGFDPTDAQIAAEFLRLTPIERQIINGVGPWKVFEFWGFKAPKVPADTQAWIKQLRAVPEFLERSRLSFQELLELLSMKFVNPDGTLTVTPDSTCDLKAIRIPALSKDALDRTHRFLRLWRKLGWTMRELDQTITALAPTLLPAPKSDAPRPFAGDDFLRQLSEIGRLRATLDVSLLEMLSWWSPIDIAVYQVKGLPTPTPLYEQIFLNKTVLNPLDPVFSLDKLEGTPVLELFRKHAPALLAALGISRDDFTLLTDAEISQQRLNLPFSEVPPPPTVPPSAKPNLGILSHLYRLASFARALDLSIEELLLVKAITGIDPFDNTGETVRFVDAVHRVRASAFSIEQLDYLLRNVRQRDAEAGLDDEGLAQILNDIRVELKRLAAEPVAAVPDKDLLKINLALELPASEIEPALKLIVELDATPPTQAVLVKRRAFIEAHFSKFLDKTDAKAKLVGPAALKTSEERITYVLAALTGYQRGKPLVLAKLREALNLDVASSDLLLSGLAKPPAALTRTCLDEFLKLGFINTQAPLTREKFSAQFDALSLLDKIALLINGFGIRAVELPWLFEHGPKREWLDFNKLPLEPVASGASLFSAWARLDDLLNLLRSVPNLRKVLLPSRNIALFDFFQDADAGVAEKKLLTKLSALTGWDFAKLAALAGKKGLALPSPKSYRDEVALLRLKACLETMKRLRMTSEQLMSLANTEVEGADRVTQPKEVKQAAKARYDNANWLKLAKTLRDGLRENQRTALVSHLMFELEFQTTSQLFQHFLIDLEMCPCQLTSRIKQAMSSTQLFIQRILMNLEPDVALDPTDAKLWKKWMKNYRVWEANRKVFLWPENWIEPALRDDKTPFFKDLENELLQNEVTADTAETALLNYLQQLDTVARLEVVGMYRQEDPNILHVFARTFGTPPIYYYRRRVDSSRWTAWEKVDVDIQGDHLIPVVYERRLRLLWPIFTEKTKEEPVPGKDDSPRKPLKYWEIQLASSVYHNNSWSAKVVSKKPLSFLDSRMFTDTNDKRYIPISDHLFNVVQETTGLSIVCTIFARRLRIQWTRVGEFKMADCRGEFIPNSFSQIIDPLLLPSRTHLENGMFAEDSDGFDDLYLKQLLGTPEAPTGNRNVPVLAGTPGMFRLVTTHQDEQFVLPPGRPFFYQDNKRTFCVTQAEQARLIGESIGDSKLSSGKYRFEIFYHPYTCTFISAINRRGINGLLDPTPDADRRTDLSRQRINADPGFFNSTYNKPDNGAVEQPPEEEVVDFAARGAYSQYNWELFFHIPLLIADQLSQNQRFEEAQEWFHYIFDPTDSSRLPTPGRYWKVRPFFKNTDSTDTIQDLLDLLDYTGKKPERLKEKEEIRTQIGQWRENPFNPHLIARLRLAAYQKNVVMKYLDNLIARGDQLCRRETIESLNEATQIYVLAASILGKRPMDIPAHTVRPKTFNELRESGLDEFSNAVVVELESYVPAPDMHSSLPADGVFARKRLSPLVTEEMTALLALVRTPYFCTPQNEKLLGYWDTVADRLFKIRHCMNLEGVVRQLPLFEPPIDPALLVRATAAGIDISSVLNEMSMAVPHYRFSIMQQKAAELCNDVKALGATLLAALEKRDAEALALLRSTQEINLLKAIRSIKERQIEEAQHALDGLQKAKDMANLRHDYYVNREFINPGEKAHLILQATTGILQEAAAHLQTGAAVAHILPEFTVGLGTGTTTGGSHVGSSLEAASRALNAWSSVANTAAAMSATMASYQRRADDWELQENLAAKEIEQVDRQILGAQIRLTVAQKELRNHDLQTENATTLDTFMRGKFTNRDLYHWMVSQISGVYFQSYQLAYDVARRAERAFRFELGLQDSNFIQFGYWDSLKKGLLSGERLYHDLKRMEVAYLDQNKREYEITKHVSLVLLDPMALILLKQTGECFVNLPEALFDLDYPGHYLRRLKSVSLSIPCVTGPYTSVNCTLTLLGNSIRKSPTGTGGYARVGSKGEGSKDSRFEDNLGAIQSIVTSNAQNDSGVFELNFRDERYLPFEGAGVISEWRLELPKEFRQFDYDTISDVVLHVRYTAREGGESLKQQAVAELQKGVDKILLKESGKGLSRLFSVRHEFPNEWQRFLHPATPTPHHELNLDLGPERFPFLFRDRKIQINNVELLLKRTDADAGQSLDLFLSPPGTKPVDLSDLGAAISLEADPTKENLLAGARAYSGGKPPGLWKLNAASVDLNPIANKIEDLWFVCHYSVTAKKS